MRRLSAAAVAETEGLTAVTGGVAEVVLVPVAVVVVVVGVVVVAGVADALMERLCTRCGGELEGGEEPNPPLAREASEEVE